MRIGIVVPAYNAAPWIGGAVASVIAQTHRDWMLVVVDDGSTDGTAGIVEGFADARVRLVRQANSGVSAARNCGVAELCGADPAPNPLPRGEGESITPPRHSPNPHYSPSPLGRGLGGGATPCSSSTPMTGWHRMHCSASPLRSTHRPTLLRPPAPAHSSD
jgi:hypothetical protein